MRFQVVRDETVLRFLVRKDNTCILNNSIERRERIERIPRPDNEKRCINVARIDPQKGQLMMIKSFLKTFGGDRNKRFWLVGDVSIGVAGVTAEAIDYKNEY